VIVASKKNIQDVSGAITPNVTIFYDMPVMDLTELISKSSFVVLALEDRKMSTGQSVLLQAMALGKAVIATRVNGTEDYIEHMKTGLFVPPNDPRAIEDAVRLLFSNSDLRAALGRSARERVCAMHLPSHYALAVSACLSRSST
jgi:glycosyltransferase involved in cell wall biosynthesis